MMADQDDKTQVSSRTVSLDEVLREISRQDGETKGLPPVHLWNPENCGDIGMEIRADGSWWHEGRVIGRPRLVKLFSRILRKDEDGQTYLVTPYEKVIVHVEDAPFLAVRIDSIDGPGPGQALVFRTNLDDVVVAGSQTPLRVETDPETGEPNPYVLVRGRLEAKLTRAVFYELAGLAEPNPEDDGETLGVWSKGKFFVIGPSGEGAA